MEDPSSSRPADFTPSSSAGFVRILMIALFVVVVALRSANPIEEAFSSHGRDRTSVFFALLTPVVVVALMLGLFAARLSPILRARGLRLAHADAFVTTGQWSQETASIILGPRKVSRFATYSLVIDRQGVTFHNGLFRAELVSRIATSDTEWVNSQMVMGWRMSQPGLIHTVDGVVPLLIVAFANPLGVFPSRARLTEIALEFRRRLGL